jgi:hypothetical protein
MANDFIPTADLDYQAWLVNFATVANANLIALGLVAGDMTPVTTGQTAFNAAIPDVVTKRQAFEQAVQNKKTTRKTSVTSVRVVVRKIQANPAVTNALKAQLGITVRDILPTPILPTPPLELVARGLDSGTNILNWRRGDNKPSMKFVIEAKIGTAAAWSLVDVVTATRFSHLGQTPGVPVVYRVRARRGSDVSEPSNEASVYAE